MTLRVGDAIPHFKLPSHLGEDVDSNDLRGKIAVLAFFPLAWTPI
ncbi:MAG: redoxin domain-containing protein [Anaerolineaceae bacterium]|jgi:peroxiredoxin